MVDYWPTDISKNPTCSHGPTLLFSRKNGNRRFFACSAFRSRKKCRFFQWLDSTPKSEKNMHEDELKKKIHTYVSRRNKNRRKYYCYTCEFSISFEEKSYHNAHHIMEINKEIASFPTLIMKPIEETKGESQYYFSDSTIKQFLSFFMEMKQGAVLCVGCPRLHEYISNYENASLKSMLLDIDFRYLQFYNPDQFQIFNMFNCYAYNSDGWLWIKKFIHSQPTIVIDPPFGGRIEPLVYTLDRILSLYKIDDNSEKKNDILILLILPYFMEPVVKKHFSNFHMLDYKVEYKNHRRFKKRDNSSGSKGSIVRIFTNFSPSKFILPVSEGYKYCKICNRWVYNENRHCYKCCACTSKNGGIYKHCDKCGKCVKNTWEHCETCKTCKLPVHLCPATLCTYTTRTRIVN